MGRPRISIAAAMGVVLYAGMILAALRSGSNDWFKVVYTFTFVVLIYGGIAARYRGPFWHGFAVAGWAYFVVGFGAWIDGHAPAKWQRVANRNLVTSVILEVVSSKATPPLPPSTIGPSFPTLMESDNALANRDGVSHSVLTVLFATLGGLFSRRMAGRPRSESSTD